MSQEDRSGQHPLLWVPTSYFAMGTVSITVAMASNILFANLGLSNEKAAAYSSLAGLAYSFKPFWAPILELYKTKKFFVVLMQVLLGGTFLGLAVALKLSASMTPLLGLLLLAAVMGATLDMGSDGVYVTTLDAKRQASFTGVQSTCWSLGPILASGLLVGWVGLLAGERKGAFKPSAAAYGSAWQVVFFGLGILMLGLAAWHAAMLPSGSRAEHSPRTWREALPEFGKTFVTFFQKRDVWLLIAFAFFYRFGLGFLERIVPLFLLDSKAHGGLGLHNTDLGLLNGLIGTGAFILGSMLGALFVARRGLKKSLLLLCLALNLPNIALLYLGTLRPESFWIVGSVIFIQKLGWGFGAVGHMIYMMQQIAPGPYRTAHYAFATGLGLSLSMALAGLVSGYIQMRVGYQVYFAVVLVAAIPSILFTVLAPFHAGEARGA